MNILLTKNDAALYPMILRMCVCMCKLFLSPFYFCSTYNHMRKNYLQQEKM